MVLALKEATLTPFLALDEFDVFMDERNRKLSLAILTQVMGTKLSCHTKMLCKKVVQSPYVNLIISIHHAQVLLFHGDSQTIIISPLSLNAVKDGNKIKKHTLKAVDRNQQSLPFGAPAGAK
jgi:hypothetical protein